MSKPIWKGHISFGLVNIPVTLYPAVQRTDLHFHLLDSKNMAHVRYERVNEETGEEVPWNNIVKAYKYDHDNYVVVQDEELKKAAIESTQTINIESFVAAKDLECVYFDKPYYIVPDKKTEKGYVLLREALRKTQSVGIAKVVIRTRQYLTALLPHKEVLLLNLLHFAQEFRDLKEFEIPSENIKKYNITAKELEIAEELIHAMTNEWDPKQYHDDFRENVMTWIRKKIKSGKTEVVSEAEKEEEPPSKVIDFMKLLKQSVQKKGKTSKLKKEKPVHRKTK